MAIEAQESSQNQLEQLYVGIDIAKEVHVARFRTMQRDVGKPFRIPVNRKGFDAFLEHIEVMRKEVGAKGVQIGLEPTGHYWITVTKFLEERGLQVFFVNPAHTKRMQEVEDNSPDKRDPKCAGLIAELVMRRKVLQRAPCDGVYADLQELTRLRRRLVVERGRCRNRMHRILDVTFPELLSLLPGPARKTTQAALRAAVTRGDFLELGKRRLSHVLRKASRGQYGIVKAKEVLAAAQSSVGVDVGAQARRLEMRQLLARYKQLAKEIEDLEQRLGTLLVDIPYAASFLEIRGLSTVTVAGLLGETGDVRRYRRASGVVKMAGLNLGSLKSGLKQRGMPHITKCGRAHLRLVMHQAVLSLVGPGGPMEDYYARLRGHGVVPAKAMVAASRKLLRVLYAMVRSGEPFREELLQLQPGLKRAA